MLASGMRRVKKKNEDLEEGEFNYDTLLKEAGRRNAELKGEEPKPKKSAAAAAPEGKKPAKVAMKTAAAVDAAPPKKKKAAPPRPPPPAEEAEEDSDSESETSSTGSSSSEEDAGEEELTPFEDDGEEFWLNSEGVLFQKLEFGGLGDRIGVLDSETMIVVRD